MPGACGRRGTGRGAAGETDAGAAGGRPAATPGHATVDFFTNQAPAPFAAVEAALATFRQQHPEIEVRVTNTPGGYQDKLQTLIVAGATPDLFRAGGDEFARFYVLRSMALLDGLLTRDRFDLTDFYPASLEQYRWGGRQHGLPSDYGYRMIFFHSDLFQRAGLPLPPGTWEAPGWTFDGFARAARVRTVREPGAPVQWGFLNPRESWQALVYANGGRVLGPTHDEVWLTRPEAVEALHFAQELEVRHRAGLSPEEAGQLPALQAFLAGRGAMLQSSTATGTTSARTISGFTWDVAPPPRGPRLSGGRKTFGGGSGWFLGATSRALEAAWTLLRFLLSQETVSALAAAGFAPPRRSVIHSPVWLDPARPPRSKSVLTDGFGGIVPFPKLTTRGEWLAAATRELAALWNGTRSAAEVAAAIAAATAPALARHRELVGASPP